MLDTNVDYYFIVYQTNPSRERVKYEIDACGVKHSTSYKNFLEFIQETISLTVSNKVKVSLNNYNEVYLLDRENGSVKELQEGQLPKLNSNFKVYKEAIAEAAKEDSSNTQSWVDGVLNMRPDWTEKTQANTDSHLLKLKKDKEKPKIFRF